MKQTCQTKQPVQEILVKCVKQCKKSPCGTYCLGCRRTIEEIIEAGRSRKEGVHVT